MKFGGTSMGSAERIQVAAHLSAEQHANRPVAIIVSAMSKVTDLLLDTLRKAEAGDEADLEANLKTLSERHIEACHALSLPEDRCARVLKQIDSVVQEFTRIARGMRLLGERPPRSVDEAIAVGERLSALLMAECLDCQGVPAAAINACNVIATDAVFGNASPLMEQTRQRAEKVLRPLLEERVLPVITGFNGSTLDGRPTTLGRGGSDFSASIIAAALDAAELWIWTDVDGIMTGDPRLIPGASVLDAVTYAEAAELAYNGAKVLHPRTLAPLAEREIPVWSKNSFAPSKPGTRIVPRLETVRGPHAVTSMADVALVSIEPANAALSGVKVMARSLDALARANIELLAITSSSYRQSFCFLVRQSELERATEFLEEDLALELAHDYLKPIQVDPNVGLIAVVGEGMRGTPGLAGRIFTAISRRQINIIAIAQGSSELTIAIVVSRAGLEEAVQAVHAECGLGSVALASGPAN
ncbi:MAG: aspartate kinase [Bryobacterales bacterium]|nr:aspartate kinase [Bryobacterales bacterium]MBV9399350.1 aspartate kinase [Bryobacterales bacterium]